MTQCRYCRGSGLFPVEPPRRKPNLRGAATRMVPFGNEVAALISAGNLPLMPLLLVTDEPMRNLDGQTSVARSRWESAKQALLKGRPIMVLPEGETIESFSWPKQPDNWRDYWSNSLQVWAWGVSAVRCEELGTGLVNAGFDSVLIQFSQLGKPITYTAG